MKLQIVPYKMASHSVVALQNKLTDMNINAGRLVPRVRSSWQPVTNTPRIALNWGSAELFSYPYNHVINVPSAVNNAGNKLRCFDFLTNNEIPTPLYTNNENIAGQWLNEGEVVLARTVLRGHSGEGIVIMGDVEADWDGVITPASLYVQYKKKKHEFRVHVFDGRVIDIQQKKRERGVERNGERNKIRNRANGWVYCREELDLSLENKEILMSIAKSSILALGLHFGAVDIIYNQRENQFYVLEINTAPGLEGQTLDIYAEAISRYVEEVRNA